MTGSSSRAGSGAKKHTIDTSGLIPVWSLTVMSLVNNWIVLSTVGQVCHPLERTASLLTKTKWVGSVTWGENREEPLPWQWMGLCIGYTHAPCWKGWGTGDGFAQFSCLPWVHILEELNSQKLSICVEGTLGGRRESALTNDNSGALLLLQMYAMRKELVFSQWAVKLAVAFLPSCISWSSILQRCSSDDERSD